MDVFLMIRRKKMTIFTDAKETTLVYELKKIIEGITKITPNDQRLFKDDMIMEDTKTLSEYGLNSAAARAQAPATVGLTYRQTVVNWIKTTTQDYYRSCRNCVKQRPLPTKGAYFKLHPSLVEAIDLQINVCNGICKAITSYGAYEPLEITPLSSPPELPDVMKPQDTQAHEQTVS